MGQVKYVTVTTEHGVPIMVLDIDVFKSFAGDKYNNNITSLSTDKEVYFSDVSFVVGVRHGVLSFANKGWKIRLLSIKILEVYISDIEDHIVSNNIGGIYINDVKTLINSN